jgi:hypothetical protein
LKIPICMEIMSEYIDTIEGFHCIECEPTNEDPYAYGNSDTVLKEAVPMVRDNRNEWGLEGLVKGLEAVVVNVEKDLYEPAVREMMDFTGLDHFQSFEDDERRQSVLKVKGSADFIMTSRKDGPSPFRDYNIGPKSIHLPDTRLETYVFETPDIRKYYDIQRERGVRFMTEEIVHRENYSFIQTAPSCFTGNSIGFIQWRRNRGDYFHENARPVVYGFEKKESDYLKNIRYLDHSATRLEAMDRDAAIIEFMELTNYHFDFAIYVKVFNSITTVARLSEDDYAQVFTTGISPFKSPEESGPTEKYVNNYGKRTHHVAFQTEKIEDTFQSLKDDGMSFLIELVGSPEEGLKQTFTRQSPNTLLVNEYIHRFGDFDGFFTKSNVTDLTRATDIQ